MLFAPYGLVRLLVLALLAATVLAMLTGCGSSSDRPALAVPKGEFRQLNVGRWDWHENAISQPPRGAAAATGLAGLDR